MTALPRWVGTGRPEGAHRQRLYRHFGAYEASKIEAGLAVDELAGFIVACAKVRPNGISDLAPKSVKKKLKDKAFAAAVSREDIATGIEELGVDMTEHIQKCIDAIRGEAERLEL